ncbi:MAG: GTPase ObgE [Verrucomicrobia bacterium GWC2_42_7]|nr:MAG: GTPase ObgE [Verrucomicrobia bacterium GWC2_42_7]
MFVDEVNVILKAGNGGDGCLSFRREKFIPKGGPNGGDGGDGGHVILEGTVQLCDLQDYQFAPHAHAEDGENGKGSDQHGRNGKHKILKVPTGTVVFNSETNEMVTELTKDGEQVILLKGGKGGKGNTNFKSSVNQAPRQITPGTPGEEGRFLFVLKTIADVGLVGYPNAGKSSLTAALTKAHPRVAPYPFTTLHPNVGTIEYPEQNRRIFLADIPGLIKGANENKGLGHRFLRHIERCHLLLFLIDMAGTDSRDPIDDYAQLQTELRLYDESLLEKPSLIVANKMDVPEAAANLKKFKKHYKNKEILEISCLSQEGFPALKEKLLSVVS